MQSTDKESVAIYCRAQAQINELDKDQQEERKALTERVRTFRQLIHDEMLQANLTCMEVEYDGQPFYFRLRPSMPAEQLGTDDILDILSNMTHEMLLGLVDKYDNHLPRMISAAFNAVMKERKQQPDAPPKLNLSISNSRERGYDRTHATSINLTQMGKDMLEAKRAIEAIRQQQSERKRAPVEEQKRVEHKVRETLQQMDPVTMTQRVHMVQNDGDWIYYLRCKEKKRNVRTVGVRKALPMVENASERVLQRLGVSIDFTGALPAQFWNAMREEIETHFEAFASNSKSSYSITLNRGAPRKR